MVLTNSNHLVLWTVLCAFAVLTFAKQTQIYSNEFAVHIPEGDGAADTIASKHGFINKGQVRVQYFNILKINIYSLISSS